MEKQGLDAFLVSTPENRRYLSGFTGSAGYLLISRDDAVLATDFRYVEQAQKQSPDYRVLRITGSLDWFPSLLSELKARKVGFEADNLTYAAYQQYTKVLQEKAAENGVSLVATRGVVEELRAVKYPEEVAALQRAIDLADQAFEAVERTIEPGETERQVAWRLERTMRELGADSVSFEIIVAAGPNGAMPHHRPSDRPIAAGEPVVIDMGAKADGYCSDLTRTICLGQPDDTFRKIYDIVLGAQLTAIATVRPGMTGEEADSLARKVIQEAGYGDTFGHSLGHGVGLAVHENPRVGPRSKDVLKEGMLFTVEPGIYITGWGGVRIEDVVSLNSDGARVLSKARKYGA